MELNKNGAGSAAGAPSAQNPGSAPAATVSALDRLVSMQDTMDNGNGSTSGNRNSPKPGEVAPDRDPGNTVDQDPPANDNGNVEGQDPPNGDPNLAAPEGGEAGAGNETLPPALAQMDEGLRGEFLQLAEDVNNGVVNLGDVKRGHRLSVQHAQEKQQLQDQIRTLEEKLDQGASAPAASLPESVSRLKTTAEVQRRQNQLEDILDWCSDNANGGEYVSGENKQEFTAEEVRSMRSAARAELRLLPQRQSELQRQGEWSRTQGQAKAKAMELFPSLKDGNNAETKQVNALLQAAPWISQFFASPHIAALTYIRGQSAMRAEMAKRGGNKNQPARNGNGVPARKPASGGTAAGAGGGQPGAKPTVKAAMERIEGGDRSIGSLAALMDATGR